MKKQSTLLVLLLLCASIAGAQNKIKLVKFSSGYSYLVGIENCGDNRLFIVQEDGKIFICDSNGTRVKKPYLDISDRVLFGGERGLLGLAFDPGYATNGFFYVNYIRKNGSTQISRFKVKANNPNLADTSSEKPILTITQPFINHKGGCTRFGPDGYLYIGMGDGGSGGDPYNNAQNPMSLLGKMLRINVHSGNKPYKIPVDNPFVDSANYRPEIWALGLRNPWRWSFDALNGNIWIADVGQENWEEIDLQPNGKGGNNYGWHCYEGKYPYNTDSCKKKSSYTFPIYQYDHSDSNCSITGGFVYRGDLYPSLYDKYFFTDYCSGIFRVLYKDSGVQKVIKVLNGDYKAYTSFGEDVHHELYVCNRVKGNIYHITPAASLQGDDFAEGDNFKTDRLSFYPNPSKGNINITYQAYKPQQVVVCITDITGRQFYSASKNINTGDNNWNVNLRVPKGIYNISVINYEGAAVTKILRIE